jgi:ubiquinol-cytochrome c reductase cytochrome c subunit
MSAFRRGNTSIQSARGSSPVRFFLVLMTVATLAEVLVLTRSGAAAQSTDAATKTASAPAGNAQRGKAVYTRVGCYECHGRDAQSGGGSGPKLGPNPIPFAAFSFQVRSPRNEMPPYTAKVLADADLADIYAFVQSMPQPPKVDSIPLLK